jgi:hypothetical protein
MSEYFLTCWRRWGLNITFLAHLGTFSNINGIGKQGNNSDTVIIDKGLKNTHVLSSGVKSEYITVTACCKASVQLLLPVQIFKDVNKKRIWTVVYF